MSKKKEERDYHVAKKHAQPNSNQSTVCPSCKQEFQITTLSNNIGERSMEQNNAQLVNEKGEDGEKNKEELSASQHFLVYTEIENGIHKIFNFRMSKLDTKIIKEKLEEVFNHINSDAKNNIALGFVLQNIETGEYRYFYAHENNTLFEKSQ